MAIVFDNATLSSATHTCNDASILLVATQSGATITYNGVSLSLAVSAGSSWGMSYIYYLLNPTGGSNTLSVSGPSTWVASSYKGVSGIGATSGTDGGSGSASSIASSITTTKANAWVLTSVGSGSGLMTNWASTSQVLRQPGVFDNQTVALFDTNATVGVGTFNYTTTWSNSRQISVTAVELVPKLAAGFLAFM